MKRFRQLLCIFLAALMLLNLVSCGKGNPQKPSADTGPFKLGSYELLYKDAKLMTDMDGRDALVLTLDFTNNSKEAISYLWCILETATQNGTQLETATVMTGDDYTTVADSQFTDVEPASTLEISTALVLLDTTSKVEVSFEELLGSKKASLTIDPSTLSREEPTEPAAPSGTSSAGTGSATGDELLEWWNGDWYGWWIMTACYGTYEELEGEWWDACAVIDIGTDYTGTVTLWDESYDRSVPMISASVSLHEAGTGEYGTVMSEGGDFAGMPLEHADWIVDPGLLDYPDMIHIDGSYEDSEGEFAYDIYLRPWGVYWDDVTEEDLPYLYDSWYLPLVDAGEPMPDRINIHDSEGGETGLPAEGGGTSTATGGSSGGDGLMSEEEVQKAYVWMSEIATDIFYATYDDLVAQFGVEGKLEKEEYDEDMQATYRHYQWISSEDPTHCLQVKFKQLDSGVYEVSAYTTAGFHGNDAVEKYLDEMLAEAGAVG